MYLEIEYHDRKLLFDLVGNSIEFKSGSKIDIPGGAIAEFQGIRGFKGVDLPNILEVVLNFTGGVATGLVASWLYDKLNGRATKLRINRKEIHINKGEIEKIIIEEIEKDE